MLDECSEEIKGPMHEECSDDNDERTARNSDALTQGVTDRSVVVGASASVNGPLETAKT